MKRLPCSAAEVADKLDFLARLRFTETALRTHTILEIFTSFLLSQRALVPLTDYRTGPCFSIFFCKVYMYFFERSKQLKLF